MKQENKFDTCGVVQDLLPLYVDGICSEGSKKLIEEHVAECEKCRSCMEKMQDAGIEEKMIQDGTGVIAHHKKKMRKIWFGIAAVYGAVLLAVALLVGILVYDACHQYRATGLSQYLGITIEECGMEKVGELDGYEIYTKNLSEAYFETAWAENIDLKEAIQQQKIGIEDLYEAASDSREITVDGENGTAYYFENYQVILLAGKCIISPIED